MNHEGEERLSSSEDSERSRPDEPEGAHVNHEVEERLSSSEDSERSRPAEPESALGGNLDKAQEDRLEAGVGAEPDADISPRSSFSQMDPLIGQVLLNRYRVKRRIGSGGMGAVYLGEQLAIGREVALKVLRTELLSHEYVRQRFRREAELIGRLNHPNIVQVLDYGETDEGIAVMAMELLRGQPLNDRLSAQGPMDLEETLRIGEEIAQALAAAHREGLVHRDLKPANVFLVEHHGKYVTKVLDFGIARILEEEATRLTSTGQIFGTPRYMPPEQAVSTADVDHRADIYSLGLILYESLVGQPPFVATTSLQYLSAHATIVPPKLRESYPAAPQSLDALIDACLQKQPENRPSEAGKVADRLNDIRQSVQASGTTATHVLPLPPSTTNSPSGSLTWLRQGLLGLGLAVGIGMLGWGYQQWIAEPTSVGTIFPSSPPAEPPKASLTSTHTSEGDQSGLATKTDDAEGVPEAPTSTKAVEVPAPKPQPVPERKKTTKNPPRRPPSNKPLVGAGVISEGRQLSIPGLDGGDGSEVSEFIAIAKGCTTSGWSGLSSVTTRGCPEDCALIIDYQCAGRTPAEVREVPPGLRELAVVCGEEVVLRRRARFREGRSRIITCE